MSRVPDPQFLKDALFLVDASSYVFRAYYAIQRPLSAPDGTPTHATFGFLQMVQSLLDSHRQSHCVLVWDRPGRGFRHELYAEYKANRTAPPEDLSVQIENAREAARLLGLPQLDAAGFEADDILATIVTANPDRSFVIVTADKDLLQLVGPRVWCLDTMKDKWSNEDEAREKFGVTPQQIPEVQALCGDSVDNVPGVPGVGPKTASELIHTFGTLDNVLATAVARHAQDPNAKYPDKLKGKCLENVATHVDDARVSLNLVTLSKDAPVGTNVRELERTPTATDAFRTWAVKWGFGRTVERLLSSLGDDRVVPPAKDAPAAPSMPDAPAAAEPSKAPMTPFETKSLGTLDDLRAALKSIDASERIAFDTETFSLDRVRSENLVGFSFAGDDGQGYYVPLRHSEGPNVEPKAALAALHDFLSARARTLVFQNAKFDLHALASDGLAVPPTTRIDDTMVASFVLDPASNHGLDALAAKHLDGYRPVPFTEVTKDLENFSQVPLEKATFYAAEDAVVCRRLWNRMAPMMEHDTLWSVYDGIDRPLVPILFSMEQAGILLDPHPLEDLTKTFRKELAILEERARQSIRDSGVDVPEDFNVNSPKQVAVILFEKLKLPVIKKTKTGASTDVSVLEELASSHEFPETLLEIRELSKLLSTYVEALPRLVNPRTGRLHTDFSQTVAATGRLASSAPNLQNIPIKTRRGFAIRKAFRAPEGRSLIGVDYSQIELRLLAHVSGDPALKQAFADDADIHRRTAALVLGKTEAAVTDDDRRIAKAINYGIVYGQTAFGLSRALRIPRAQAQSFIDGYFKTYGGIRAYMDAAIAEARKTGAVRTLSGRRRWLPEIHSKNVPLRQFAERMAINTPLQGLAADLMKVGMIRVYEQLKAEFPRTILLLQVHDELIVEAPQDEAEAVRKRMTNVLEDTEIMKSFGIPRFAVPLKADSSIGASWADL